MTDVLERESELLVIEPKDAFAIFTAKKEDGIDPILARVRREIDAFTPSLKTASGRKAIASIAHRVSKSKTYLDAVGKALVDEYKEIPKKIDATRKHIRDTLDQWRDEVRQPLTDWEKAEEARVNRIKTDLAELQNLIADQAARSSEVLRDRLAEVKAQAITEEAFGEYAGAAAELKDGAIATLEARILAAEKREADAAELVRLRAEAEERAAKERDERIAKEASEAAQRKAEEGARRDREQLEAKAKAERDAAEKRELQLRLDKEAAERRALEAAQKARQELEEKAARELKEQERREADTKHKAAINRKALAAFIESGVPEETAKAVIKLIASKAIPNISIQY